MRHDSEPLAEHRLFGLVFEKSPDELVIVDGRGNVVHANRVARDARSITSRLLAHGLEEGGDLADFTTSLRSEGHATAEKRLRDPEGMWCYVVLKGTTLAPDRFAVTVRDVTQAREVEAELAQLRRVESLGFLTASVVHDFNNLLTPIVCLSALLTHQLDVESRAGEMARDIRESAERAAGLVRQMLSFVRRAPEQPRRISVGAVVAEMSGLLRRVIGDDIELVVTNDDDAGDVIADREQLEQVLLNLAANARDAMPTGGRLVIATTPVTFVGGEPEAGRDEGGRDDGGRAEEVGGDGRASIFVALRVSDTGTGMSPEVRERVFERFFTTKPHGEGTGLGLAAAHRFARASHGCISVRSSEGTGTTVTLCLPRLNGAMTIPPPASHQILPLGSETVLVVEDDTAVRGVVRALLEAQGYRVLDAPSGRDALEVVAREKEPIDLLLTDVVMPQMSGRALADVLAAMGHTMKVLFMSGHTDPVIGERGVNSGTSHLLRKAFSPTELLLKVREVLGASQAA
jgi:two-component system cell cycle sensor histidine kinase/response regulator CckA